jgi:hypothetical protein
MRLSDGEGQSALAGGRDSWRGGDMLAAARAAARLRALHPTPVTPCSSVRWPASDS